MFPVLSVIGRSARRLSPFGLVLLVGCYTTPYPLSLYDALTKGHDISAYLAEQQLDEAASGNAILGQGGPVATPGRMSFALSGMRVSRAVPSLAGTAVSQSGSVGSVIAAADASATRLQLDLAVGVIRGLKSGDSRTFSLELLGHLGVSGDFAANDLHLTQGGNGPSVGFGLRTGLLTETARLPGLAFTMNWRALPSLSWGIDNLPSDSGSTARIHLTDYSAKVFSFRLTGQKSFGPASVTAGWGRDRLQAHFSHSVGVSGPTPQAFAEGVQYGNASRSLFFAGGSFRVTRSAHLAAEVIRAGAVDHEWRTNAIGSGAVPAATRVRLGVRLGGE